MKMPTVRDPENENEEFEILDIRRNDWLQKSLGELSRASVAKQTAVGGVTGWCAGYVFVKVGKAAAIALGGSLLIMQIAQHRGYIKVNWTKLEKEINTAKKNIKRSTQSQFPRVVEEIQDFIKENMFLAGGFAGGFLLGLAT